MSKVKIIDKWDSFAKGNEQAMDRALARMALDIERGAKMKVPVKKGQLKSSGRFQKVGRLSYIVYFNKEYAAHVEFGTKPHVISPKNKGFLAFQVGGNWVYTKKPVNHPGFKGRYYLSEAIQDVVKKDVDYITREVQNIKV